ncbi:STAS domain-containing protein [Microbispora sp. ATCC PTA-5024]|uniref:STAS domain-containing protein n=1 Tax=Microbispora sp. ATCC PTA-5024 TaxID=316330 RepID=UPI0003DDCB0E|nr:STAS domain-containing protein [Microbispora sp. ATCC PTA-5024]ETK35194.1 anti-anti-sigma factor [Microbispora sp. ATCC PTA-5024]
MTAAVVLSSLPVPGDAAGQVLSVALTGALDFTNAERLGHDVEALLSPEHRGLVLDMSGVEFCDSTGIRVLLIVRKLVRERGGDVALAGLNARLTRIFRITGLIHAFTVTAGPQEAAEAVRTRSPSA